MGEQSDAIDSFVHPIVITWQIQYKVRNVHTHFQKEIGHGEKNNRLRYKLM